MLSLLSGLAKPTAGDIIYDGKSIAKIDKYTFRSRYIGVVFQSFNLITKYTALENVILSMDVSGAKIKDKKKRALELLISIRSYFGSCVIDAIHYRNAASLPQTCLFPFKALGLSQINYLRQPLVFLFLTSVNGKLKR